MIQRSWKFGGIALLAYVLWTTFTVPLGPGLLEFRDLKRAGSLHELNRKVSAYELVGLGTHWSQSPESLQVVLRKDGNLALLSVIDVIDDTHATIGLALPDTLPSRSWDVLINHPIDGTLLLQNGLFIDNRTIDENTALPKPTLSEHSADLPHHFPFQPRIFETIRNLMLHVPMWFTMFLLMGIGFVASIRQLGLQQASDIRFDQRAEASVQVGMVFGVLGLVTGSLWARYTWGAWWVDDPQLNGALVTVLVYAGYLILRASVEDERLKARLAAVYNLFAFVILMILLMVLPRFTESLHPGKGGNPGFNSYDLDSSLRAVFYPAVLGWMLLGTWMFRIRLQANQLNQKLQALTQQ
jgi:heme exporter protein C